MFFHVWEKWYVQSEATQVCEFRAKIPASYCSLQRHFEHIQREKFYSKSIDPRTYKKYQQDLAKYAWEQAEIFGYGGDIGAIFIDTLLRTYFSTRI